MDTDAPAEQTALEVGATIDWPPKATIAFVGLHAQQILESVQAQEPDADFALEATLDFLDFEKFVQDCIRLRNALRWDHARWLYALGSTGRMHLLLKNKADYKQVGASFYTKTAPLCGKAFQPGTHGWAIKPVLEHITPDQTHMCVTCYRLWFDMNAELQATEEVDAIALDGAIEVV
jgi:hypothetical protein